MRTSSLAAAYMPGGRRPHKHVKIGPVGKKLPATPLEGAKLLPIVWLSGVGLRPPAAVRVGGEEKDDDGSGPADDTRARHDTWTPGGRRQARIAAGAGLRLANRRDHANQCRWPHRSATARGRPLPSGNLRIVPSCRPVFPATGGSRRAPVPRCRAGAFQPCRGPALPRAAARLPVRLFHLPGELIGDITEVRNTLQFILNDRDVVLDAMPATRTLLDFLRLERGLRGSKEG